MGDIDVDCPFDEKSNFNSNHLTSTQKNDSTSRRSSAMNPELNDETGDNINGDEGHRRSTLAFSKNSETSSLNDFDSDEDTFADAESDCEPNQMFLDEMLEDIHPERLSLFDYTKSNSVPKYLATSDPEIDENDVVNDSDDGNQKYEESSSNSTNDEVEVNQTLNDTECESTSEGLDEKDDSFGNLPTIQNKGKGKRMPLNSNGTSEGGGPGKPMLRQPSQRTVWGK